MFNSHADNVALFINVNIDIFAYLFCLLDRFFCKFYLSGIGVGKIFHFHVPFLLKGSIKKNIMHCFAIIKQNNPQIFSSFCYSRPFSDPTIGLYFNFCRILNNCLDPIILNMSAIRTFSCIIKILCCFHLSKSNQIFGSERENHLPGGKSRKQPINKTMIEKGKLLVKTSYCPVQFILLLGAVFYYLIKCLIYPCIETLTIFSCLYNNGFMKFRTNTD